MAKEIQVHLGVRCNRDRCDADRLWHSGKQKDRAQGPGQVLGLFGHRQEFNWG